ncbi:glycoside hydrolase N-terminal domain-containing protein [Flavobacterium sp. YO64]|uniref:glycoside hydrolase family 95 protein n=1 Tax=Flavobacterium sp. YO64 TaxID=394559 RepID=UPI00100BA06A|nr:glycoside hydrolase family 95 protein [Flavobacterium sp. YO64]RXM44525.1 glycosyl hydrolase [Flavobacterium sp. YO64]
MNKIKLFTLLVLVLFVDSVCLAQKNQPIKLWYKQPAVKWSAEALPIGNGRLGAMFFGGVEREVIQFNEQSLWSGDNNWDGEYETGDHGFGSYRNFGEITIDFTDKSAFSNYSRSLDISNGIHQTEFIQNKTKISREGFASYPDQVMVFEYKANGKNGFSGTISFNSAQGAISKASMSSISFIGEMPNKLKYAAKLLVQNKGGKIRFEGENLIFENCNSLTLILDARTNYKPDYKSNWRGEDPMPLIEKELSAAKSKGYEKLRAAHLKDLSSILTRVYLNIGSSDAVTSSLPTDERLKKYTAGGVDPDLEETMFQYGRYLLASSSRRGGLPANLQGLWNDSNTPAWASDYHNNINVQMNYWGVESTNLSECHLPLIDFIVAAQEPCRIATRKAFGEKTRGWTARTSQNIFGGNGWEWNIPASAWYAQHVYEHWAFTRDNDYLRSTAYPIIKEVCEYWEDNLKTMPDGQLMVPNGWSPEHGPREDGVMMDQQLVWDLFQNYLDAAKALNIDSDYQKKVADMQARLAPNKIGKWGQLQEWQADRDDPNDEHRHTSHLFAVYPGRQISNTITPELAKGAVLSLRSRSGNFGKNENTPFTVESTVGDSRRSWTWPWRCAIWARLGEGDRAAIMLRGLLTYNTLPNLFCNHPPFQLDGNFGITAAMAEMLIQSQTDKIQLLPALPKTWEKGEVKGLCARGGFEVDMKWDEGKLVSAKVLSKVGGVCKVQSGNNNIEITTQRGKSYTFNAELKEISKK